MESLLHSSVSCFDYMFAFSLVSAFEELLLGLTPFGTNQELEIDSLQSILPMLELLVRVRIPCLYKPFEFHLVLDDVLCAWCMILFSASYES